MKQENSAYYNEIGEQCPLLQNKRIVPTTMRWEKGAYYYYDIEEERLF